MKQSVWMENVKFPEFPTLKETINTDVLVIGGGLCGILCAYYLQKAGVDCVVAEGNRIACGITKNTTAKITAQHGLIYGKLAEEFGLDTANLYLNANLKAIENYEALCRKIPCHFEKTMAYTYSLTDRKIIERETETLHRLGYPAIIKETVELPFETQGAVCFPNQAQFHPYQFISKIIKNLTIYEHTWIREITPTEAISDDGRIRAKKIIVATHFPFINKHGSYFLKLYQHRSYVTAFENAQKLTGMYVDEQKTGMSFRNYGTLLLIGGGGHRTGKKGGNWREIERFARTYYPDTRVKYRWATQDCMSLDGIPYIGQYSKSTPDLYVATGFNKWGMTSSLVSAMILTDLILDKENEFAKVFSPQRSMLKPQLLVNGFESTLNLLTPTKPRCPHLGCALKWNRAERSWDCPCHGSRFEKDGCLIDNPATGDANCK